MMEEEILKKEIPFECCTHCRNDMSEGKSIVLYATLAFDLKEDLPQQPIARLCESCAIKFNDWLFGGDTND